MTDGQAALTALEGWLQLRLEGNVDRWHLDGTVAERIAFRGQAGFTFDWEETRSRADGALAGPSIDDQVRAALDARPLPRALAEHAAARPQDWLRPVSRQPLPDHEFRHTRLETCDSCSGRRTVGCGGCGASGSVTCGTCSGSRTERIICRGCGGVGYFQRSRMGPNNQTEHYRDTCWGCGGGGRINETCRTCRGSGDVTCSRCGGSGQVTCTDCGGQGKRLYLYTRRALVDGRTALALDDVPFAGWADILRSHWPALVGGGAIAFADIRVKDEVAGEVLKLDFDAAAPAVRCTAYAGEALAALHAVGAASFIVVDGEPLLVRALGLPAAEAEADWVALTEGLAGKRLLREAIDVTEAKAAEHKSKAKDAYQAAQSGEIVEAMTGRYGALLGPEGAGALASMVMKGIEPLKDRVARKSWRTSLAVAALIGLVAALAVIVVILQQESVRQTLFKLAAQIVMGTAVVAIVWGAIGHWRVRRELRTLSLQLDLERPLTPPRHGWPKRGGILAALITIALAAGLPVAAWKAGVPQSYAQIVDRQIEFADGTAGGVELLEATRVHQWPDEASRLVAELPARTVVRISNRKGAAWRFVRFDEGYGYVRSSALGIYAEADPPGFMTDK